MKIQAKQDHLKKCILLENDNLKKLAIAENMSDYP